jgi:hypothetical protein
MSNPFREGKFAEWHYLHEWIASKDKLHGGEEEFYLKFVSDCKTYFPEFDEWLKKKKSEEVKNSLKLVPGRKAS